MKMVSSIFHLIFSCSIYLPESSL